MKLALSLALLAAGTAHAGPGLVFTIELDKPSFVLHEPVTEWWAAQSKAPLATVWPDST